MWRTVHLPHALSLNLFPLFFVCYKFCIDYVAYTSAANQTPPGELALSDVSTGNMSFPDFAAGNPSLADFTAGSIALPDFAASSMLFPNVGAHSMSFPVLPVDGTFLGDYQSSADQSVQFESCQLFL